MIKEIMKNSFYIFLIIILLISWLEVYQNFQLERIETAGIILPKVDYFKKLT